MKWVELILASRSPRRRQMLAELGLHLRVEEPSIDEGLLPGETPEYYVRRLAHAKASSIATRHGFKEFVLGADTTVSIHGEIFGKPKDADDARRMLLRLSGGPHTVTTGYALAIPGGRVIDGAVTTIVNMRELSLAEIEWYIGTGEPFDKAGAYALQGRAAHFITSVQGSVSNVIGLPLAEVVILLRTFGIPVALQPDTSV